MRKFTKPDFSVVSSPDGLSGDQIAKLSDEELSQYLKNDSYMQDKKRYRIKDGYILREIAGEYAIIPVDAESQVSNALMTPNQSAAFLWKAFEQPSTIEDVVIKGMLEYEVTKETLRSSVERFVKESLEHKILEEVD